MAKDATTDFAAEIEDLISAAKKKPHNFCLMKAKEGVVLKAHPIRNADMMVREAKQAGGMSAFMTQGVLNVSGRTLRFSVEDVPRSLPKAMKQYLIGLKVKCKLEFVLPSGEIVGEDGSVSSGAEKGPDGAPGATPEQAAAAQAGSTPPEEAEKKPEGEAPKKRANPDIVRALVRETGVQVQHASDRFGAEAAKPMMELLQKAVAALKAGDADAAMELVEQIRAALADQAANPPAKPEEATPEAKAEGPAEVAPQAAPEAAPGATEKGDPDASERERLIGEFKVLGAGLKKLQAEAAPGVSEKAGKVAQFFVDALKSDVKKAGQALGALKQLLAAELAKLREAPAPTGGAEPEEKSDGLFESIGETLSGIGAKIGELKDDVVETVTKVGEEISHTVQDAVRGDDDSHDMAALMALGMTWDEADKLVDSKGKDPKAVEKVLTERLSKVGVPKDRQAAMLKEAKTSPKTFAAALGALGEMDKDGAVDVSDAKVQESREALEKARQSHEKAEKELAEARRKLEEAQKILGDLTAKVGPAQAAAAKAAQDLKDLEARVGDPTKLTPEQAAAFAKESTALINANEAAKKALEKAIEDQKKAAMAEAKATETVEKSEKAEEKTKGPLESAQKDFDKKEGKKALLDAMSFGALSPSNSKLSDEDKAAFASAFGKDAKLAQSGIEIAKNAPNPSAVAKHTGYVAGKAMDGFADEKGNKLDLPEDERRKMAENALRMGGMMGEEYFAGFETYLKSGKQFDPDPSGGMDAPDPDPRKEELRQKNIAVKRSTAMGAAALTPDGKVDFSTEGAKAAMDQMMFHPGSLKVATPMVNAKIAETKKLFEDPKTKNRAISVIGKTKLPADDAVGRKGAADLVARTTGKAEGDIGDNDAKVAVLSAMMSPMSQGMVGSCFATATTRGIRETDPIRAMDEYSKIATTGVFTANDGMQYPANRRAPPGENPLMRSWEYSVATAAQDRANSSYRTKLNGTLVSGAGIGFDRMKSVAGVSGKWNDSNTVLPNGQTVVTPGIASKLRKEIAKELKFEYQADLTTGGGANDGSSSLGRYQIMYKGAALDTQPKFVAAMNEIALKATGDAADSDEGKAITAIVTGADFVNDIIGAYTNGKPPWAYGGGGLEKDTLKVMNGGNPTSNVMLAANPGTGGQTQSARNLSLLKTMVTQQASMPGQMSNVGTFNTNGPNHAFNTMPKDPSVVGLQPPDVDGKIQTQVLDKGQKIATTKLPVDQVAEMYREQLEETMKGLPSDERDLIVAAMKKAPKTEMTPKEITDKVNAELQVLAQPRLDKWFAEENKERQSKGQPVMPPGDKAGYLQWFKDRITEGVDARMMLQMMKDLDPPQVVIADTNWGGPDSHTYFVMVTDPRSGDLVMMRKDGVTGSMTPAGQRWEDANWDMTK